MRSCYCCAVSLFLPEIVTCSKNRFELVCRVRDRDARIERAEDCLQRILFYSHEWCTQPFVLLKCMVKPSVLRNNLRSAELVGALPHGTAACLLETRVRVSCAGVCVNILTLIESSESSPQWNMSHIRPSFPHLLLLILTFLGP